MSNVEPHQEHHSNISQGIAPMNQEHDEQLHKGLNTEDITSTFTVRDWIQIKNTVGYQEQDHMPDTVTQ
jgi:hypothetical protein